MLWANSLALAALDAVRCFTVSYGVDVVVIIVLIPVVKRLFCIHAGKKVRDGDIFRASVCTVTAGGTWDKIH
jgi:hypothetical protein